MAAGQFNILADQGANYVFYFTYEENDGSSIDLKDYTGRMQVRRSAFSDEVLISCSGNTSGGGVTGGGNTGSWNPTTESGVAGTGNMILNASNAGLTGISGTTGGVFISLDSFTMQNVPHGKHVYDVELIAGNTVSRIVQGRFEVRPEVTR